MKGSMRDSMIRNWLLAIMLLTATLTAALPALGAIVTNWVAYNDHSPNYTAVNGWVTAPRVTTYNLGETTAGGGNLTNFLNGQQLSAALSSVHTGNSHGFGLAVEPNNNTPAAQLFKGIVDIANNASVIGVQFNPSDFATINFSGLDPNKHYVFRGTGSRGGSYPLRWTVATIKGAQTFVDAHINGAGGPGVLTSNNFPADLVPGQGAWNAGDNREGAVIGWDFITPALDGTFSIESSNYVGHITGGGLAANSGYSYAIDAILLAEVEVAAPAIVTSPPASTTVEQNRPFSLTVVASGTPLFYQWYKQGAGAISGATFATYSVSQAALGNTGDYYARVYNPLASVTSTLAHVTVNADVTPPGVATVFSYPNVDFTTQVASLNQVIIEFNEVVQAASATDPSHYLISGGGGNPVSVILTNARTVALTLSSALAEDTAYTVQVSGVLDLVGNPSNGGTNNPAPFRTWMRGPANALLFERFDTGGGPDVVNLTNSPVFPDNPSFRTNLWILDSRAVYPDDTQTAYGSRIRGVFIPPVSGNWIFLLRSEDSSRVFFNPNGLDAAGKQQLVEEVHADTDGNWGRILSGAVNLKAGSGYYIEALQTTDTGVNFIKMAARLQGAALPVGVANADLDTNAIMGAAVAFPLAPRDLGGALTISQDLADLTVEENNLATFSLQLSNPSGLPLFYQWYRNGGPISGASGPTFSLYPTIASDNGATFSVQVAKVGTVKTSRTATLTVVKDVTPPRVIAAFSSYTNLTALSVRFNEPMDPGSADPFNFTIAGFLTVTATLEADRQTMDLQLDNPLVAGTTYQVDVANCADLSGNVMRSTNFTFIAGSDLPRLALAASSGNQVTLSWPAPSTGFNLEQAPAIVTPSSSIMWSQVGTMPTVVNGRNTVVTNMVPGIQVFRLHK